jgi:hypothetical protein
MYSSSELISLARDHGLATGMSPAALSKLVTGNSKLFVRLLAGEDCTMRSAELASVYFDLHWPDAPWPADVRPRGTALAALRQFDGVIRRLDQLALAVDRLVGGESGGIRARRSDPTVSL